MLINATLLVQIINFFVGYLILRFLFFLPAYRAIDAEKRMKADLENAIRETNNALERKRQVRDAQWKEVQLLYVKNSPNIQDPDLYFNQNLTLPLKMPQLSENQADDIVQKASHELKNRIRKIYHV